MAVSHEVALRDELLRSRDHDIATLTIALREARAENERLRAALKAIAATDLGPARPDDSMNTIMFRGAISVAYHALRDEQSQKTEA